MKYLLLTSFFDDFCQTLEQHPYLKFVLIACSAVLVILIILAVILATSKKEDKSIVEENTDNESSHEDMPVEEKNEDALETSFEEEKTVENISEEVKTDEEHLEVEESKEEVPLVDSKPKTKKPSTKKAAVKKEVSPTVEETPVIEEVKTEETLVEENKVEQTIVEEVPPVDPKPKTRKPPVKKTVEKKKDEGKEMTKEKEVAKTPRVVYGKYEVYTDGTSYYYNLKASNGEVLIKSEAYAKKESVLSAIEAIKRNISAGSIVIREDKHGLFQFVLVAKNHRTLVMSANYATEARAKSASQSFVRFAETAPIVELTDVVETDKELIDTSSAVDKKGGKVGVLFDGEGYYYFLKASNGEVLVHSTSYKSESSALSALERFKEAVNTGKFYVEKDKRDNYQFKLFSSTGRIVGVGQIYSNKAVAISSAMSVRSFINLAVTVSE